MSTALTVVINTDAQDQPYNTSGVEWTEMNTDNDYFVFSAGSDVVKDGEAIPSANDLNQAGVVVGSGEVIVDKYFLADISANLLREIHNAGNQNKRYVFAFDFDGATASEPVLEVWDDENMDSADFYSLGNGTPSSSWVKGITTTDALPGADWTGSALAGSSDGHFLWLNDLNGALSVTGTLYCNLKIVVPASATNSGAETPTFVCKFTTN